jgi:hypothetical protein
MKWYGWLRCGPGKPWRRFVEADTIGEAAAKLAALTRNMRPRPSNRDEFLTTGAPPRTQRTR